MIYSSVTSCFCPLCGGNYSECQISARDFHTKVPGIFQYRKCNLCGSYIQSPLPTQEFLNECYESQALGYFNPPEYETMFNLHGSIFGSFLKRFLFHFFPRLNTIDLLPEHSTPAKILEIGCSYGYRLYGLKKMGYDVTGIELNKKMVLFAKEKLHLDVREGQVEKITFDKGAFDIIIMSMVLEHCLDPRGVINRLAKWIRPGGELLVSVPCCDGFEFKIFRENCYIVQPPYHVLLPSLSGIYSLMEPHFNVKQAAFQYFHRDLVGSAAIASSVKSNSKYRLLAINGSAPIIKRFIQGFLFLLTILGLKTSRISFRCIRKRGII